MKFLKAEGFTLIEILVGINLSLILITMIISFYLFSVKFVSAASSNLNEKQVVSDFLLMLNNKINKADSFYFIAQGAEHLIVIDNKDTLTFTSNNFNINNLYELKNIEDYSLLISLEKRESILIKNNLFKSAPFDFKTGTEIPSSEIRNISIEFTLENKEYKQFIVTRLISDKQFNNIR